MGVSSAAIKLNSDTGNMFVLIFATGVVLAWGMIWLMVGCLFFFCSMPEGERVAVTGVTAGPGILSHCIWIESCCQTGYSRSRHTVTLYLEDRVAVTGVTPGPGILSHCIWRIESCHIVSGG